MTKTKPQQTTRRDDPEQSRLFIKKARDVGADEKESAADKLLGALHHMPPKPHVPLKRKRGAAP